MLVSRCATVWSWGLPWLLLLAGLSPGAFAQTSCVAPTDAVVRAVMYREEANTQSSILGRFLPGEQALVIGDVPGWYQVRVPDGSAAYVSKRWTEPVACRPPLASAGAPPWFELHVIDVGTGLAVLVRGQDFVLLFDAGSNDDQALGERNRVLAYLHHVDPNLTRLDHVLLSHPHQDHVALLPDVMDRYVVGNVWNSGAYNDICSYRSLLEAIAAEPGVTYHTAGFDHQDEVVSLSARCHEPAHELRLHHSSAISSEPIPLGQSAQMVFLHADGVTHPDLNDNSLVVRLDLGSHRVLLVGDAGGGSRQLPATPPSADSIEGQLLACCSAALAADVLVVGHHGSKTSSRTAFLDAVHAGDYLISSGPKKYSGTTLPDHEVVEELSHRGKVWRTDLNDQACAGALEKIGEVADGRPGGCSNIVVRMHLDDLQVNYDPQP